MANAQTTIHEREDLHNRIHVFADRAAAGKVLAEMLAEYRMDRGLVLAIPAGGVPVAAVIARLLGLPLDVAVTSKITLPWNTESGYGAVAFDGSVKINDDYVTHYRLTDKDVESGTNEAKTKVERRLKLLRMDRPFPVLKERPVIVVDDGLASGITLKTAITALRNQGAKQLIVAIPTGHVEAVQAIANKVDQVYCANIRGGLQYAVADAYEHWTDVEEAEVINILRAWSGSSSAENE